MTQRICSVSGCSRDHRSKGYCSRHYQQWLKCGDPTPQRPTREENFWAKTRPTDSGCWEWQGGYLNSGYGAARTPDRVKTTAHRAAWEWRHGAKLSADTHVCHRCDNRKCVNPDHLFLGSRLDNMADMVKKGRSPRGERQGQSRLTESDVRQIRELASSGAMTQREIGSKFCVSQAAVSLVVSGRNWRHIA